LSQICLAASLHKSDLCLPSPSVSLCQSQHELLVDRFFLGVKRVFVLAASCEESEVECANHECVPRGLWCDGRADCSDSSDEWDCGEFLPCCTLPASALGVTVVIAGDLIQKTTAAVERCSRYHQRETGLRSGKQARQWAREKGKAGCEEVSQCKALSQGTRQGSSKTCRWCVKSGKCCG